MGKIKRSAFGKRFRKKDWKKAYVKLDGEVDPFFQKIENSSFFKDIKFK